MKVEIKYSVDCTTVYNCYLLKDKEIKTICDEIIKERKMRNFPVTRTKKSYINEIKAHKRLYLLNYKVSHTKDADLEEPITKSKELFYKITGC